MSANTEEAVKLYELACKGKNGPACRSASFAHLNGDGTPVNVEKGLEYGAIACEQVILYPLPCLQSHDGPPHLSSHCCRFPTSFSILL